MFYCRIQGISKIGKIWRNYAIVELNYKKKKLEIVGRHGLIYINKLTNINSKD